MAEDGERCEAFKVLDTIHPGVCVSLRLECDKPGGHTDDLHHDWEFGLMWVEDPRGTIGS